MNLFVAVIIDGFSNTLERDNKWVDYELIEDFRDKWSKFDPFASGFIKVKNFKQFMLKLGGPLGWGEEFAEDENYMIKIIMELGLPTYNDGKMFSFVTVLNELYMQKAIHDMANKMSLEDIM